MLLLIFIGYFVIDKIVFLFFFYIFYNRSCIINFISNIYIFILNEYKIEMVDDGKFEGIFSFYNFGFGEMWSLFKIFVFNDVIWYECIFGKGIELFW